uniref:Uncharacterized protein n=1 Tax=Populus alba TaxID=43335 RepID=A0A4U5QDT0_POPAL|nr:hypothetical protein D5086_0000108410 [Populus alba]
MAVGGAAKVGVFAPFPVKDQLPGVDSCVSSSPSWPKAILLGFQHYLVMLGTTVIIPSIFVLSISRGNVEKAEMINTLLFVAGINTLLQTWFGTRLPVVIGGPYAFSIPTITISLSTNNSTNVIFRSPRQVKFELSMKAVQGALVSLDSGDSLQDFSALLLQCLSGFLPDLGSMLMNSHDDAIDGTAVNDTTCVSAAFSSIWLYGHMPAVLAVAGAYNNKHPDTQLSCLVDRAGLISAAPWIKVPYPFQWGRPTFDAGDVFVMMDASCLLVQLLRYQDMGVPLLCLLLYSAVVLDGCENAGLLGLTRVGSQRVVQISAGFMLFFSVLSAEDSGLFLLPIPLPIVAALYCVIFAYAASAGLGFLQFCNSIASERSSSLAFLSSWAFLCHSTSRTTFWFLIVALSTPVPPGDVCLNCI